MSDLIDRNLIAELVDSHGNVHWEDIAGLPSEQHEVRTQISSADCISRRDAIDALKDMYHAAEKWREEASDDVIKARAESCMTSLVEMKLRIENLPSAQPEIIQCYECKWFQCNMRTDGYVPKGVDAFECRHWCGSCDPVDFCSYAERREE